MEVVLSDAETQIRRRAEEETEENFSMMPLAGRGCWIFMEISLERFDFFGGYFEEFRGAPYFWSQFIFWRPWRFRGCSLLAYVDSPTLMGLFELRGCAFLSYSDFCCLLRARGGVLDLRALSKVMLRAPFRAMLFCIPFSVA